MSILYVQGGLMADDCPLCLDHDKQLGRALVCVI
ncbi:hypothetical protein HDF15_004312 [Granulicella mallensis]|uniref:Uncharacterized protein n=1 Tax=Granulicella mallensis TaxID=940614 RepID=A0A7W8EBL2_9BACT|nr:hypothetical protein [Granulicella mallensis]